MNKNLFMYKDDALVDRLRQILEALELIPGRFQSIAEPKDFFATPVDREHLDSISMVLLAVGESFSRSITKQKASCWRIIQIFLGER